jgi:predicted phage terminase large subunit-like protein
MNEIDKYHQMELEIRRRDLHSFVTNTFPNFIDGWFYHDLCEHLFNFMMEVRAGLSPRLIINVPPRHGKSEICSVRFPVYCLLNNPTWEVILTSYGQTIVDRFSRRARGLLANEYVNELWNPKLAKDQSSVKEWRIGDNISAGNFKAVGRGGAITGSGGNCLYKGTLVKTNKGDVKIEDLRENDLVLSFNHKIGCKEYKKILATKKSINNVYLYKFYKGYSFKYYKSVLKRNKKNILCNKYTKDYIELKCTDNHKIYIQGYNINYKLCYKEAKNLDIKDNALYVDENEFNNGIEYEENKLFKENCEVYDIQVEGNNNFFANGILVHNCLIADDIIKDDKEADSLLIRDNTYEWFTSTFRTRLAPGGGILIIQTRWHLDDVVGRIKKENIENWKEVVYPALAEEKEKYREIGDALHEPRYPKKDLEILKATLSARRWNGLFRQKPTSEGGEMIKEAWFKYYDFEEIKLKEMDQVFQVWDLRFGKSQKKKSSYVVGQVWARKGAKYFILDQYREKVGYADTKIAFKDMCDKWPEAIAKVVEKKANGEALEDDLAAEIPGIDLWNPRGDKVQRVELVIPLFKAGNVYLPRASSWLGEYKKELTSFPNSENDDQIDCTSMALAYIIEGNGDLGEVLLI